MVSVPPRMAQKPIGISRFDKGILARVDIRDMTGMNSAVAPTFCIIPEIRPTVPETRGTILPAVLPPILRIRAATTVITAGAVQPRAEDHDRDDGQHSIGCEAVEKFGCRNKSQQADHHHDRNRRDIDTHKLGYEKTDGGSQDEQHQHHVAIECQARFHGYAAVVTPNKDALS